MLQKNNSIYIPALTGLRALAAYLVFIHHFHYIISAGMPNGLRCFFREFNIGLPVFFALAGFSIAYRYYNKFSLNAAWFKNYMLTRVARIYPMYFVFTLLAFVGYAFTKHQAIVANSNSLWVIALVNFTFLRGFFDDFKFTGVGQGWSLTVNMCFYIAAPFIFYVVKKYKIIYLQPAAITLTGVLLVLIFRGFNWHGFFGNFKFVMFYTFFGRCLEFFIGVFLVIQYFNNDSLKRVKGLPLTLIGFTMMLLCVWALSKLPVLPGQLYSEQSPAGILINNYVLSLSAGVFFWGVLTEDGFLKKVLSTKFVIRLGKSSYVFYLIHLGIINDWLHTSVNWLNDKVFEFYDQIGIDWHSPFECDQLNLLYIFVILNAVALFLYTYMEEPLNLYVRKKLIKIKA